MGFPPSLPAVESFACLGGAVFKDGAGHEIFSVTSKDNPQDKSPSSSPQAHSLPLPPSLTFFSLFPNLSALNGKDRWQGQAHDCLSRRARVQSGKLFPSHLQFITLDEVFFCSWPSCAETLDHQSWQSAGSHGRAFEGCRFRTRPFLAWLRPGG